MSFAGATLAELPSSWPQVEPVRLPISLRVDRLAPHEWDEAIARFDGVNFEQTVAYATLRWPSLAQEPLIFRHGHEIVGGALMLVQQFPLGLGSFAIAKWAPMPADSRHPNNRSRYRAMVDALIDEYATRRRMFLAFVPRASADAGANDHDWLAGRGFVPGPNVPFPDRYIVDLDLPDDRHRKMLASKWRYHLNHAEKSSLEFEVAPANALPQFDALYEAMTGRKRFPDHSAYETVPALMSMPVKSLRPQIFFVRHNGKAVAGAVIFTASDTAVYLYGATAETALPLRAGYFMHWQIVRWLKTNTAARWYDLGGNDGFSGLHQFKKGLVGKAGAVVPLPPMLHFAEDKLPHAVGVSAFAIRHALRQFRNRLRSATGALAKPDLAPRAQV